MNLVLFSYAAGTQYINWSTQYMIPSIENQVGYLAAKGYSIHQRYIESSSYDPNQMLKHLRDTLKETLSMNGIFIMVPPDTVFSNDSIINMVKLLENNDGGIAIPHLRVNPLPVEYTYRSYRPVELVDTLFKYPHYITRTIRDDLDQNTSWCGVSLKWIDNTMVALTHSLPSVYALKVSQSDIDFWNSCPRFDMWDRDFELKLWNEERIKIVGSSDICCMVEQTQVDYNLPPLMPGVKYNYKFAGYNHENRTLDFSRRTVANKGCEKFSYILRGSNIVR